MSDNGVWKEYLSAAVRTGVKAVGSFVPGVAQAIDIIETVEVLREAESRQTQTLAEFARAEQNISRVEKSITEIIEREMKSVLSKLAVPGLSHNDLEAEIKNLCDMRKHGREPFMCEGLLSNSQHYEALRRKPNLYGRVLQDHDVPNPDYFYMFIDADKTRLLEVTPFALQQLLSGQAHGAPAANIIGQQDLFAQRLSVPRKMPGDGADNVGRAKMHSPQAKAVSIVVPPTAKKTTQIPHGHMSTYTMPESPEYVLLWMFAEAHYDCQDEQETRRNASRTLNFICISNYANIEIHPNDYARLQELVESNRETLTRWSIDSKNVDLIAGHIRVNPDALVAFLDQNSFNPNRMYNPGEPQRRHWFKMINPDLKGDGHGPVDVTKAGGAAAVVSVTGTSPSTHRAPRVLDLANDGDDIVLHIHMPARDRRKFRLNRTALQSSLNDMRGNAAGMPITIPLRGSRDLKSELTLLFRDGREIEVQIRDDWWIWVDADALKSALKSLGVSVAW